MDCHRNSVQLIQTGLQERLSEKIEEANQLKILRGGSDANIGFDDLRGLLLHLGFEERVRSSHHIFFKSGVEELINVQRSGSKAKPYQVRQVRAVITRHGLGGQE